MNDKTNNTDDWETHWLHYAESAMQNPAQQMRYRLIASVIEQMTVSMGMITLVDFGSGQGDLLALLSSLLPDAKLLGIELSSSGVEISKAKAPGAKCIVADIYHPSGELREYQGWASHAVCSEVLEHVDTPVEFLQRARAYLAENAQLIVTVPGGPMSKFDRHIGHRRHFTKKSISSILEEAGFRPIRIYRAGFPFFNMYRLTVIARGSQLINDVRAGNQKRTRGLAAAVMKIYGELFHWNLRNSPFGWQIMAVAQKLK